MEGDDARSWCVQPSKDKEGVMRRMLFAAAVALGLCATAPISNAAVTVDTVSGQAWWQFFLSFPRAEHPMYDKNGDACYVGQHGDMWFLALKFGGTAVRSCEVPEGVALVVPATAMACFPPYPPGEWETCDEWVNSGRTYWVERSLTVDGVSYAPGYTVSGPYKVWYPVNGLSKFFGGTNPPLKAGVYEPALDGGNYAKISGLALGQHVLHVRAVGDDGFFIDVTWNITVK
jgi:hypothetical protein